MLPKKIILGLAILIVVIVSVGIGWALFKSGTLNPVPSLTTSQTPGETQYPTVPETPLPSSTPEPTVPPLSQAQIRDAALIFTVTNHNETKPYTNNFMWTGGRVDKGLVGAETYQYFGNGWNVTMKCAVVPDPIYNITAEYVSPVSEVLPEKVIFDWQGTWQNGTIVETFYKYTP